LSMQWGDKFKIALSVSGISLSLLEKFAPEIIDQFKSLAQSDCMEFLAEPWSNSILPYFNQHELTYQTELHCSTIHNLFHKLPVVFAAHTPLYRDNFFDFIPFSGCRAVVGYYQRSSNKTITRNNGIQQNHKFLINYHLSEKLQKHSYASCQESSATAISPFIRYIRKHTSLVKPLILFFNPLMKCSINFKKWENMICILMEKTGGLYSLSDLAEITSYFSIPDDYSEKMLLQFTHPDYWLKSNMQKEAFQQFQSTWKILHNTETYITNGAMQFLQDLDNFYYMADLFYSQEFSRNNFSPCNSPHEAFSNYMNAAGWILHAQKNYTDHEIKNDAWLNGNSKIIHNPRGL
jgi:alpha-amylase